MPSPIPAQKKVTHCEGRPETGYGSPTTKNRTGPKQLPPTIKFEKQIKGRKLYPTGPRRSPTEYSSHPNIHPRSLTNAEKITIHKKSEQNNCSFSSGTDAWLANYPFNSTQCTLKQMKLNQHLAGKEDQGTQRSEVSVVIKQKVKNSQSEAS